MQDSGCYIKRAGGRPVGLSIRAHCRSLDFIVEEMHLQQIRRHCDPPVVLDTPLNQIVNIYLENERLAYLRVSILLQVCAVSLSYIQNASNQDLEPLKASRRSGKDS